MSRGYTPRHAQTAGDLSFAVQFNDETLWHFVEEEFCDLLGTVDSTGKGSLCYNGECWAVPLVRHCEPILETLTVTHRYLQRERHPIFPYICLLYVFRNEIYYKR